MQRNANHLGDQAEAVAPVSDSDYQGSRKRKQRFPFKEHSRAAFIELGPEHVLSVDDFKVLLEGVRGEDRAVWHSKGFKAHQGNPGRHYQMQNFLVYSMLFQDKGMEFELTRDPHMKDPQRPYTISAMFRETIEDLSLEAWRILEKCASL